jgi:hypothetical protein
LNLAFKLRKKGAWQEALTIAIMLFVFAIVFVCIAWYNSEARKTIDLIKDQSIQHMNQSPSDSTDYAINITNQIATDYKAGIGSTNYWDYVYIFIFMVLLLSSIISSYYLDSSPIFFVASFILFIAVSVVVPMLANAFGDTINSLPSLNIRYSMPIMYWIMSNFLAVVCIYFMLIAVILYAKYRG